MDLCVALDYRLGMKILGGKWGGRQIPRKVNPKMRPTTDKVREAVFDILQARVVEDWAEIRVLDLFAGTGAFGFEALSRGARNLLLVDNHWQTARLLEKSIKDFEIQDSAAVICRGVLESISWIAKQGHEFDLIFMDPPYRESWVTPTLNKLKEFEVLAPKGLVIAEHDKRELLSPLEGDWCLLDARRYGDTVISFFCPKKMEGFWKKSSW